MGKLRYYSIIGLMSLLLVGCSEERKREAARLAAELEAQDMGESLAADTVQQVQSGSAVVRSDSGMGTLQDDQKPPTESELATQHDRTAQDSVLSPVDIQAEAVQSPKPALLMPPIVSDGYTVQVESSPIKSYIEQQVETFKQRGYDAYLSAITRLDDQKTYYRLRIGRFVSSQEAETLSKELNASFGVNSWVDKTTLGPPTPSGEQPH